MATFQLGPEKPPPFAVLSEGHVRRHIELPYIPDHERFSFGEFYEQKMCALIHRYLELNTDDRLCYIGDTKGSLVPLLQQKFCLLKPVTTVIPGHIHFEETPNHRMLPIRVASVGAEDFFRREALKDTPDQYDKILLHDAVNYLDNPKMAFANIRKCLAPGGKLLIIHRAAPFNTLPMFKDARVRITENDLSHEQFIRDLQSSNLDVVWDIECIPARMLKDKWYAMVKDHFPHEMETVSNYEVTLGLRELSEGIMKYSEGTVEFNDRLLFVTGTECVTSGLQLGPGIRRHGGLYADTPAPSSSVIQGVRYQMDVTPELRALVRAKEREQRKDSLEKCSLFN